MRQVLQGTVISSLSVTQMLIPQSYASIKRLAVRIEKDHRTVLRLSCYCRSYFPQDRRASGSITVIHSHCVQFQLRYSIDNRFNLFASWTTSIFYRGLTMREG